MDRQLEDRAYAARPSSESTCQRLGSGSSHPRDSNRRSPVRRVYHDLALLYWACWLRPFAPGQICSWRILRCDTNLPCCVSNRPRLRQTDRLLWAWLSRTWPGWRDVLVIVRPETVIAWRRRKFRTYWTKLSRSGKPGRPKVAKEVRDLIRQMSIANPLWGSPHIVGELEKIGITLSRSTVAKYMVRHRKPPSQTWKSFLKNIVPTVSPR